MWFLVTVDISGECRQGPSRALVVVCSDHDIGSFEVTCFDEDLRVVREEDAVDYWCGEENQLEWKNKTLYRLVNLNEFFEFFEWKSLKMFVLT